MSYRRKVMAFESSYAANVLPRPEGLALNVGLGLRKPGRGEVVLVISLALTIYTALLIRLPYRAPVANLLYSALALSALYGYLRFRLSIHVPLQFALYLGVAVVLDIIGNRYGLFSTRIGFIPYDTITHFATSAVALVVVMWLISELIKRFDYRLPLGMVAFFSATTTFSLAAYYEITELLDERLFGGHRLWTPRDSVQDLAADLAGIIVAAACYIFVRRRHKSPGKINLPV